MPVGPFSVNRKRSRGRILCHENKLRPPFTIVGRSGSYGLFWVVWVVFRYAVVCMGWLVSLLDGHEFGISTSMFRLRGCSKSVVEVLAVV